MEPGRVCKTLVGGGIPYRPTLLSRFVSKAHNPHWAQQLVSAATNSGTTTAACIHCCGLWTKSGCQCFLLPYSGPELLLASSVMARLPVAASILYCWTCSSCWYPLLPGLEQWPTYSFATVAGWSGFPKYLGGRLNPPIYFLFKIFLQTWGMPQVFWKISLTCGPVDLAVHRCEPQVAIRI